MFTHLDKLREIDVSNENQLETSKDEIAIVSTFKASQAYVTFINFVCDLNRSVFGKSISSVKKQYESEPNSVTTALLAALDNVNALMDQAPPHAQRGRFGNPAFRTFLKLLQDSQEQIQAPLFALIPVSEESKLQVPTTEVKAEAGVYLSRGFGDERRIDYGTGHEANFVCWLACLKQLGVFASVPADKTEAFYATLVCLVFNKYLSIIRKLQTSYWLEPAGSRGVWGLDDYHFLPFFWGAAQLRGHARIRPKSVRYPEILEGFSNEYMYLASLQFIHDVKVCSFAEHSPLLNDITAVKTWDKVNEGLLKMYNKDVLGRFAVVQHFIYSSILPKSPATEPLRDDGILADAAAESHHDCGHSHEHSQGAKKELPCCSDAIRFPSVMAAGKTSGISARLAAANPPLL